MIQQRPAVADPLVGRQRELNRAQEFLDAALAGTGGLLLLTGEAGIGKTRLTEALAARCAARTVWGWCWDDPGTPAFWPWTTALRELASRAAPGEEVEALLGAPASGPAGPAQQVRLRLFDSVASYLRELARSEPLLIALEDLHFADSASLELLRFVATALRGAPVAIIGTHRYPDVQPGAPLQDALADLGRVARSVPLVGLGSDHVGELIAATTGTPPSNRLTDRVAARTGGNPLFVTEVAKLLAVTGRLTGDHLPLPQSVQQVIANRLGYLSGAALDLLGHAAVIGQVFPDDLLGRVSGEAPGVVADLLDEATAAGLVRPVGGYGRLGFTHALVHDVLYAGIASAQRRALHRLVGEAIQALHGPGDLADHLDRLAEHYFLALPDADASTAAHFSRLAGRRALRTLAYEQAAQHFTRAVELAGPAGLDEDTRIELLLELGDARMRSGDVEGASLAYTEVAESARRRQCPKELARAALGFGAGLSGFEVRLFDLRQLDLLREALDAIGDTDLALRAWLLARLSVAETNLETEETRTARSEQAVKLARTVGDPKLLAYALSSYCDTIPGPEHTEARLELAEEMIRLGQSARDGEAELLGRRFRVVALLELGDIAGVDAEIEGFSRGADLLRWPLVEWYPLLWRGMRALIEGRLDDAMDLATQVTEVGRRGGSVNAELVAESGLRLYALLEQGRPGDMYAHIEPYLDDPEIGPNTEAGLPLPLARMGRRAEARAILDKLAATGFPLVVDASWTDVVHYAAQACAEVGHVEAASVLLPIVEPFADRFAQGATAGTCGGSLHRHCGLLAHTLGRPDDADAHFRQALAANRRAGATLLVAHTLRQHAQVLLQRDGPGDREEATRLVAEANDTYRQLGLETWISEPAELGDATDGAASGQELAVFRREGDIWALAYGGRRTQVRDSKGMGVLARLLAEPGRELHVLDLVGPGAREERFAASGDTGEVIDAQARTAYKRRLAELESEIDDATLTGDTGRADRAQRERDALVEQLTAAYGLGGRVRRGGDAAERARSAISKQIRGAISRIGQTHPALAQHLTNAVKTGRYCAYTPEHPVIWRL